MSAANYSGWKLANLRREYERLEQRKIFVIVSARVRAQEDAQIDAIVAELRAREARKKP